MSSPSSADPSGHPGVMQITPHPQLANSSLLVAASARNGSKRVYHLKTTSYPPSNSPRSINKSHLSSAARPALGSRDARSCKKECTSLTRGVTYTGKTIHQLQLACAIECNVCKQSHAGRAVKSCDCEKHWVYSFFAAFQLKESVSEEWWRARFFVLYFFFFCWASGAAFSSDIVPKVFGSCLEVWLTSRWNFRTF